MHLISALQCEYKHMRQCKSGADGVRSGSRQELAQLSPLLSYLFLSLPLFGEKLLEARQPSDPLAKEAEEKPRASYPKDRQQFLQQVASALLC